jgi:soluble lytic murein transglycosylase-like protein
MVKKLNNKPMDASQKRKRTEQRIVWGMLTIITLAVFSAGVVFGYLLCSELTPQTVSAAESQVASVLSQDNPDDAKTQEAERELAVCSAPYRYGQRVLDVSLVRAMYDKCQEYDVPFALALALAEQESGFNPDAKSKTNDYGLMQINKVNFGWLREKGIEPLNHKGNIEAGVLMLSNVIKKYGNYHHALMAYNCGEAGAKRLWKKGIYSTSYSRSVMERYSKWDAYVKSI